FKLQDVASCESGAKSKSYSVKVEYVSASGLTKTSDFKTISIDCTEVVTAVKTPVEEKLFIRGSALSFQGSGSYITVGDGFGSFDDGFTPFTLSAWIKLNNPTMDYSNVIMAKQKNVFCRAPGYSFLVTNGKLNAMLWNYACEGKTIGVESVNSVVNNDEWTHVVMTYSGSGVASGVKFYANGQPVDLSITSDGLAGLSIASEANFSIGALGDGTDWFPLFKGAIDQPLVFNREISPNEVSLLYNGGDGLYADITIPPFNNGLIGGWHFDEGFGESVSDFTGNNNQGSITGSSSGYCGDYYEQAPCQAINGCSWSSYYDCYDSEWNWIGSYSESECYNNGGSYFYDYGYGYCEGTPIFEDPFVTGKVGHYEPA
nr:LamG domain-containing protein [archaeon]